MGKGVESGFAVVAAHSALSDAAEGQVRSCQVQQNIVDAAAAEGGFFDDCLPVADIPSKLWRGFAPKNAFTEASIASISGSFIDSCTSR